MPVLTKSTRRSFGGPRLDVACAFGQVLRDARHFKGLSQEALALEAGVERTYPSLLERGLRTPTITVVIQFARVLGISPQTLIARTLDKLPSQFSAPWTGQ